MPRKRPGAERLALGVDLGGTKILAGVVTAEGKVLGRGKLKTPFAGSARELAEALVAAGDLALAEAGARREDVAAVGIGAPGPLDVARGVLLRAGNLAVKDFPIADAFRAAFPKAVRRVENDVRVAALGEARFGAGKGAEMMVAVWVGTGIGGAVVLNGRLWTGRNKNAGEIGQTQVDVRRAEPGKASTTLEGIAAKVGMTAFLRRKIGAGKRSALAKVVRDKNARLSGSDLRKALEKGDALARRAVDRSARAVGISIANLFDVLSPDLFVLGGGVAEDVGPSYVEAVRDTARAFAFSQELGTLEVAPAALGDDAGLVGAALYALSARSSRAT